MVSICQRKRASGYKQFEPSKSTLGQWLADKMADQVGSWAFIIVQSIILAVWIVLNLMPGFPHWDESPFIMLNLVFSFAAAYTAPIVLMSQNRQSDIDRQNAEYDHQVNLKSGMDIEDLHEKMDTLQQQQIFELKLIIQEQQLCLNEIRASLNPFVLPQISGLSNKGGATF